MRKQIRHREQPEDKTNHAGPKKPLKVLSTSLGLMLAGHLLLSPTLSAETTAPSPTPTSTAAASPKLVEWSNEEVKAYYNPSVDWSIPLPKQEDAGKQLGPTPTPSAGTTVGSSPTVINNHYGGGGGGFGWDDLLLYHMIFNRGSSYSSSGWVNNHSAYDYRTNQPYKPQTYTNRTFSNQPSANMTTPRTNSRTGSFSTNRSSSNSSSVSRTSSSSSSSKSTSSSSGSIGSKSSGFSSSSGG